MSISVGINVSTYGLISANRSDASCNLLLPVGSTICLLKVCDTYQLSFYDKYNDTTNSYYITR
jgi:hypothetical protein